MTLERPHGPPPIGRAVHTRLTVEAIEAIEYEAEHANVLRAEMIRTLIDEALMYRARKAARRAK